MATTRMRAGGLTIAVAVVLSIAPVRSDAIAPALLLMVKQIARQAASSMIEDTLLSGLNGLGCKGMALKNALSGLELRGGGAGGLLAGMPRMPAGMAMPTLPGGTAGPGGLPQMGDMPPEMAARMAALMPGAGQLPAGLDADQMAMFARMQQAMAQPLSPAETVATLDELAALGFLPPAMQVELKECMVLVPAAVPALGMGMGMLKSIVPQLRQAREQLHALPPAEQDDVAAALVQEVKGLPADERAALLEHLDAGFFPARISRAVKAGVAGR